MAKKITIQHLYNTGNTVPNVSELEFGEIAICANAGNERIYTKNSNNALAAFPSLETVEKLIDDATEGVITNANFSELQSQVKTHIENTLASDASATTRTFGHVVLVNGDLKDVENTDGAAAGLGHTHSQYLTGVTGDSGQSIVSIIEDGVAKIGLTTDITNQINSGVTAYGWGNHADKGYAKNSDLTAHTGSADIHVTTGDKNKWNTAANAVTNSAETWNETTTKVNTSASTWNTAAERINTFMDSEQIDGAVDTLKEIQQFLDGTGSTVQTLLDNLSELTTDVENNTTAITKNTNNITTISGRVDTLNSNVEQVYEKFVQSVTHTGSNIKVEKKGVTEKSYEISHTAASTQSSAITATNASTGLNFGDTFEFVNNIGYDKNGHVVSGSTQTLKLPTLPVGSRTIPGIVQLVGGNIAIPSDLQGTITSGQAAASSHWHDDYVKFTDLYSGNTSTGNTITISCGTY